jgi:hypothetical protein
MIGYRFSPSQSEISQDREKLNTMIAILEKRLGHQAKVVGILEIGSFAKHEGVPCSDSDLRVYVESPEVYFYQTRVNNQEEIKNFAQTESEKKLFLEECGTLPWQNLEWFNFNEPNSAEISEILNLSLEFGVADARFTEFRLNRLDQHCLEEHQIIMQSNILYDPAGTIKQWQHSLTGIRYQSMCDYYQRRYLDNPPSEIYLYLKPGDLDANKIKKSGQILWVKWAVRTIRDAASVKMYQGNGRLIYKKQEILDFYKKYLPQHYGLVSMLYEWKTDPDLRGKMVGDFIRDSLPLFAKFNELMPKIEQIVADINRLEL